MNLDKNNVRDRLKGCLCLGALGDSLGRRYESRSENVIGELVFDGIVTDDTQLTLATCEAIYDRPVSAEAVASSFLNWFNYGKLTGLGASTLKALRELQAGGHWALVGRSGEYAAGNGAAMRIAPLAFKEGVTREIVRDICTITHKNDEAYTGALAIYLAIRSSLNDTWNGEFNLIKRIVNELPDMQTRDRLLEFSDTKHPSVAGIRLTGRPSGYVVETVPLAIFAAQGGIERDPLDVFMELIKIGGDTDTLCSMAGQIMGSQMGYAKLSANVRQMIDALEVKEKIDELVEQWIM